MTALRPRGSGSVVGIATGYGLDTPEMESRLGATFSAPVQTGPGAHPASCTMGTGSLPGVNSGRCVRLTPHPLLVPRSWKGRAIPLLPLRAVRPVQSLSACTRVHFTFFFIATSLYLWSCFQANITARTYGVKATYVHRVSRLGKQSVHKDKLSGSTEVIM